MRKRFLTLLLLPLLLVTGCNESKENFDSKPIEIARSVGEIGDFSLLTPENGFVTNTNFTFTWEKASNADYYQLEIGNTETFINDPQDVENVYVKENNISLNKYDLNFTLPIKNETYYWRVTAVNKDHKKQCDSIGVFRYTSSGKKELPIEIENEQDWTLHKQGSYADISIDRNYFFGKDKKQNSLVIKFDKEHTLNGQPDVPNSKGWIVVTKSEDRELYDTDAFYFNFFYSGHDSTVLVRVLDKDGEYWHNQVKIANNAKQTILMKYDDFTLRTAGTNVNNRVFDWQRIHYFEIVFEKTFGDGVCVFSDIKAVNYEDYSDLFMKDMDFNCTNKDEWTYENYDFQKDITEDGREITLSFTKKSAENPNGFNGYGFQNINLYKFFDKGDALKMKIKYTGVGDSSMFYFRVLEEDNDRWQYKMQFGDFKKLETLTRPDKDEDPEGWEAFDPDDEGFMVLIIPLKAFQRTDYMQGDGAKQFYFIQKFNVGLADNYSSGTITIKDLTLVEYSDIVDSRTRVVESDGVIENFNNYNLYTEIYYQWDQSFENKDEAMKLDSIHKVNGKGNTYCGEFDYKADMEMAVYQLYMNTDACVDKDAFSIWLCDASVKPSDPMIDYLEDEQVASEMTIQLTLSSGEWYRYVIDCVKKDWFKYTISFDDFELVNEDSLFDTPQPLSSDKIIHMAFGFKYFYYLKGKDGKPDTNKSHPTYVIANPVYLDEICFTNADATTIKELGGALKPDAENPNQITVDTFESNLYPEEELFDYWEYGSVKDYNLMEFSDDVSSIGGAHSLRMQYQGNDSVSYVRATQFHKRSSSKGIAIDIKGDGNAIIYLNLNLRVGSNVYKMRYSIVKPAASWTHYEIGYDYFVDVTNGSFRSISQYNSKNIESISFGIVNNLGSSKPGYKSNIYIDNIRMLVNAEYSVNTKTVIPAEQEDGI